MEGVCESRVSADATLNKYGFKSLVANDFRKINDLSVNSMKWTKFDRIPPKAYKLRHCDSLELLTNFAIDLRLYCRIPCSNIVNKHAGLGNRCIEITGCSLDSAYSLIKSKK